MFRPILKLKSFETQPDANNDSSISDFQVGRYTDRFFTRKPSPADNPLEDVSFVREPQKIETVLNQCKQNAFFREKMKIKLRKVLRQIASIRKGHLCEMKPASGTTTVRQFKRSKLAAMADCQHEIEQLLRQIDF